MCDTIGKLNLKAGYSIFAKNSDREYQEPQIMVYIKQKNHRKRTMNATYIEIEQVKHTHAILISKPIWIWGAEMGVNDCGVCIGNEAIYTKTSKKNKESLIGMDYVRLGLERSSSAKEAVEVILELLSKYGQGGNCGYTKESYYDNSFLIMDRNELYVLETVGKSYALRKENIATISNCLSIRKADEYNDVKNFKGKYQENKGASGIKRRKITYKKLKKVKEVDDVFPILMCHHSNKKFSICMHGEYETTNSMVVVLKDNIEVYFTGSPNPCESRYLKYIFGDTLIKPINNEENQNNYDYWKDKRYNKNKAES